MSQTLTQKQGSVVGVSHDMILVRFDSKGVLFQKDLLLRAYKHDDIVQFNARKARTTDKEVGERLSILTGYEIEWVGTEIKYIKAGRWLQGEGVVLTIPDGNNSQFMFVDWRFSNNSPKNNLQANGRQVSTNVFVTRATVRPEIENLREMFRNGQRVKFIAREQAPNEKGVCWRALIATDEHHDIMSDNTGTTHGRHNYKVVPKTKAAAPRAVAPPQPAPSAPRALAPSQPAPSAPSTSSQRPLVAPPTTTAPKSPAPAPKVVDEFQVQKPPPVDGFDYFDTSREACDARFRRFASMYRESNPACMFSQKQFEGYLKIKYLQQLGEELSAIRAAELAC